MGGRVRCSSLGSATESSWQKRRRITGVSGGAQGGQCDDRTEWLQGVASVSGGTPPQLVNFENDAIEGVVLREALGDQGT